MNINHMSGYTTVRDVWHNLDHYSGKIRIPFAKKISLEKTTNFAGWLLRPESNDDLPRIVPEKTSILASAIKTMFWIATAIAVGFLIAQLSS